MTNFSKYINIKYVHQGESLSGCDCYGLIKLIFKTEKGINLPDYEYSSEWYQEGKNYITENVEKLSHWLKVRYPEKPFDVIFFYQTPARIIVNHIGLYIDDDKFIHISELYKSRIDRLTPHWVNRIYHTIRYQKVDVNG